MELAQALASQAFQVRNLTAAINKIAVAPSRVAKMGLFEEKGIKTTKVEVEFKGGSIIIVPDKPRGADGTEVEGSERELHTFTATHLPLSGNIWADDITNMRSFGSNNETEQLNVLIAETQEEHRASLDATIEYQRIGAMMGKVLGKEGKVIVDLFKKFGISVNKNLHEIDFTKPLASQFLAVKTASKKAQSGVKGEKYAAFCSEIFFASLMDNESFAKAFELYNQGSALRDDISGGVLWQGVRWEQHTEEINDKLLIPAGEAIVFPTDKRGLFLTRFAPAPYNETVGTVGLPFYSKSEAKKMDKGIDMENQSNPINICTDPLAVRRLTIKA